MTLRIRYEHKVADVLVDSMAPSMSLTGALDMFGREGWEVVSILDSTTPVTNGRKNDRMLLAVMRRYVETEPDTFEDFHRPLTDRS